MSDDELTEMHEGFEQTLRTMLMAASKIRERVAERRAEQAHDQQRRAGQTEHAASRGHTVQQTALTAELAPVHHDEWWQQASPTRIARFWELSTRFSAEHPEAAAARDQLRHQMQQRYGIDPDRVRADDRDLTRAITAIADDDRRGARETRQMQATPAATENAQQHSEGSGLHEAARAERAAGRQDHDHGNGDLVQAQAAQQAGAAGLSARVRNNAGSDFTAARGHQDAARDLADEANTATATPTAAEYQRARAHDMPTADPATRDRRVAVADAFPQPASQLSRASSSSRSQPAQTRPRQQHKQPKLSR